MKNVLLSLLVLVALPPSLHAADDLPDVPEGFVVDVVAAEPMVSNPCVMAFDKLGRICVAQGPQWRAPTPETPGDRIDILIDEDGDGTADDIDPGYGAEDGIMHPHMHPGIWLGFGDVDGNDYWRLQSRVAFDRFIQPPSGDRNSGSFAARNLLLRKDATKATRRNSKGDSLSLVETFDYQDDEVVRLFRDGR